MAGLAMLVPKELYSAPKAIPIKPTPVVITSNWMNGLVQTFTIKNRGDKEKLVILCPEKDSLLISEFIDKTWEDDDYIVFGKHKTNIEFIGVQSFIKYIAGNPTVVKNIIVQSDNIRQMNTSMEYIQNPNLAFENFDSLYLPFHNVGEEFPPLGIIFPNLYLPFNAKTLLRIPMKAGCSLSLTFIYED